MIDLHPIRNLNTLHPEDQSMGGKKVREAASNSDHVRFSSPSMKLCSRLSSSVLRVEARVGLLRKEVTSGANLPSQDSSDFIVKEAFVQVLRRRKLLDLFQLWLLIRVGIAHILVWVAVRVPGVCGSIPGTRFLNPLPA